MDDDTTGDVMDEYDKETLEYLEMAGVGEPLLARVRRGLERRYEPIIFDDIRRNPNGQVRVYTEDGRLFSGQPCFQVVPPATTRQETT